ncbi:MAG: 50S ribosomal protein L13 [Candidatus Peregrinibacteria bacterium]
MFKTYTPKADKKEDKKWYFVDADGKTLGHLATVIAVTLRGKNKTTFAPHLDKGDYVVVTHADKIKLTGSKESQKEYIHHTGYLGHLRRQPIVRVRQENPTRILQEAVAGMIPRNRLKKGILAKLFIYAGAEHPHGGQNPEPLPLSVKH